MGLMKANGTRRPKILMGLGAALAVFGLMVVVYSVMTAQFLFFFSSTSIFIFGVIFYFNGKEQASRGNSNGQYNPYFHNPRLPLGA